jgi:hypothetical protein
MSAREAQKCFAFAFAARDVLVRVTWLGYLPRKEERIEHLESFLGNRRMRIQRSDPLHDGTEIVAAFTADFPAWEIAAGK